MSVFIFPHKLHGTCKTEICGSRTHMRHSYLGTAGALQGLQVRYSSISIGLGRLQMSFI